MASQVFLFLQSIEANSGARRFAKEYELFSVSLIVATVVLQMLDSMKGFPYRTAC